MSSCERSTCPCVSKHGRARCMPQVRCILIFCLASSFELHAICRWCDGKEHSVALFMCVAPQPHIAQAQSQQFFVPLCSVLRSHLCPPSGCYLISLHVCSSSVLHSYSATPTSYHPRRCVVVNVCAFSKLLSAYLTSQCTPSSFACHAMFSCKKLPNPCVQLRLWLPHLPRIIALCR